MLRESRGATEENRPLRRNAKLPSMRVLTWNTNFRRNAEGQVAAIVAHAPDLVVLQEVRKAGFEEVQERFAAAGLPHFATSHDETGTATLGRFVVVASRFPFGSAEPVASPAPEASVALDIDSPGAASNSSACTSPPSPASTA